MKMTNKFAERLRANLDDGEVMRGPHGEAIRPTDLFDRIVGGNMTKKKTVEDFLIFMRSYQHSPEVDTECDFGEHWWCSYDNWTGYSFVDFVNHVADEWEKV
jgi:hypothetical protein